MAKESLGVGQVLRVCPEFIHALTPRRSMPSRRLVCHFKGCLLSFRNSQMQSVASCIYLIVWSNTHTTAYCWNLFGPFCGSRGVNISKWFKRTKCILRWIRSVYIIYSYSVFDILYTEPCRVLLGIIIYSTVSCSWWWCVHTNTQRKMMQHIYIATNMLCV